MIGFLDLPSGLSGDMFLSCLVDAGWPIDQLQQTLNGLHLGEDRLSLSAQPVMRCSIRATQVSVQTTESHHHRHLQDVVAIIQSADLAPAVKESAVAVFTRLAHAEAKVHGTTPDHVHFHEVGALDAIADIVGVIAGLHALDIQRLYASPVPLGSGWAQTDHGRIPVPAPATLELLAAVSAPTCPGPGEGELITPTGAALLAQLATFTQPLMQLQRIALGAGQKQFAWPNVARLWVGQEQATGPIVQIETNIDDMNPQLYNAISEKLLAAGALDVWLTPVQMKKGRPAILFSVLAPADREPVLAQMILRETTTLGLRRWPVQRQEARREFRTAQTPYGKVRLKLKWLGQELLGATPEYEDCRALAEQRQLPVRLVYEAALAAGQPRVEAGHE